MSKYRPRSFRPSLGILLLYGLIVTVQLTTVGLLMWSWWRSLLSESTWNSSFRAYGGSLLQLYLSEFVSHLGLLCTSLGIVSLFPLVPRFRNWFFVGELSLGFTLYFYNWRTLETVFSLFAGVGHTFSQVLRTYWSGLWSTLMAPVSHILEPGVIEELYLLNLILFFLYCIFRFLSVFSVFTGSQGASSRL